jgi:potassium/hydrogen antiporter
VLAVVPLAAVAPMAPMAEPNGTAWLLVAFAVLAGTAVVLGRASERFGVPVVLVFLLVGVLAGSEGLGRLPFEDYRSSFRIGTIALVLILFDGGLNTSAGALRRYAAPAATLATVGVLGTAALSGVAGRALGYDWPHALLLGAIVSSTDAAAVFAVLRGSGIQLKRRVGVTLEAESGINDPVAVLLTTLLTQNILNPGTVFGWHLAIEVVGEFAVGTAVGCGVGFGGRWLLGRIRLPASGLYPVLTLSLACLAFGSATLAHGSGFLAVYVAALALGNGTLPYRAGVLRVHDALGWLAQVGMFLVLGLLVFPSRLVAVAPVGLGLGLWLAFIARPVVVAACLAPFRYPPREIAYVGWVGLRGAVPIVLSLIPLLAGVPEAYQLFNVVFFVVVLNALVPGGTVAWATRLLGLEADAPPPPRAGLDVDARDPMDGELLSFYVDEALAIAGRPISELPLPDDSAVTVVVRGRTLIAPKGPTVLEPGDHVYVLTRPANRALVELLFGRPEGSA